MRKFMEKSGILVWGLTAIILALVLGSIKIGDAHLVPQGVGRIFATFSTLFSQFLSFAIPLIIIGLVPPAIADLGRGADADLGQTDDVVGPVAVEERRVHLSPPSVSGNQDDRILLGCLLAVPSRQLVEGTSGDGVEAGDAVDGHAASAPDDPGRHQPGPQPGEGGRPGGRDDGVQRAVDHVGGG